MKGLEAVRQAGYELGKSRPLTPEQQEVIRGVVRLHVNSKRAA